jgi:hypothetical protein
MDFNFEDFIPIYPSQDDPEIQRIIGTKKEFLDVKGVYNEAAPSAGNLYKHQEAFKRYMAQYDRMLNIHSVGTGKTCALVAVVEFMKNNPNFKRAYVLEKGESTKEEFKKQIVSSCTKDVYISDKLSNVKDETQKRNLLTRTVKKVYNVMSYGDLVKEVKTTGTSPEEIEKNFSGCIFIVDEAHNLIDNPKKASKSEETMETEGESKEELKDKYNILWKLFHNVKRSKVILATATPMINEVNEIAKIMNLILPIDRQMPTEWDYNKVTLQQLEPFFRGRVSYVRGLETGAIEDYQGEPMNVEYKIELADEEQPNEIPFTAAVKNLEGEDVFVPKSPKVKTNIQSFKSQNVIYPLVMSDFQKKSYLETFNSKKSFRQDERNASCLVFPDGSYGGDFDSERKLLTQAGKYIEKVSKNEYKITNEFKKALKVPGALKEYSVKYDFIINNEIEAARLRKKGEIVGNAFCYHQIKTGSGTIVLSKLLEEFGGFEKYNEASSVFSTDKLGNKVIRKDFEKKLRYGIITASNEPSELNSLLELFNSEENFNGDYCQIILGTESSRDGINIYNALRGYLAVAGWHPSGTLQALARIMRTTSHNVILNKMRQKLENEGKDSSKAIADVKIYKLASVVDMKDFDKNRKVTESDTYKSNSVDLDLYMLSDIKDLSIRRMMKFLKQCAVDCSINHSRNIRPGDVNGSAKCDYGKCDYVCYTSGLTENIPEKDIDYSTYDILYIDDIVKQCQCEIRNIISKKSSISIKDLYTYKDLSLYKKRYINMAIDYLIKEKIRVKNRFGFPAFINTDGNIIFTQNELPTYKDLNTSNNISSINIYKDMLFTYSKPKFNDLISIISNKEDIFSEILKMKITDKNFETFSKLYDKLSDDDKIKYLEDSLIIKINSSEKTKLYKENSDLDLSLAEFIIEKYKNFIFVKNEPTNDILNIKSYLETSSDKRGRSRKNKKCPMFNITLQGENKDSEIVYLHTMAGIKIDVTSFRVNTQYLNPSENIRILKLSEKEGWRNVHDFECQAYKNVILKSNQKSLESFSKFNYFGTIAQDKKFRIIETKTLNFDTLDMRSSSKGTVCSSYKQKFDLIDILRESDYIPDIIRDLYLPYETREELEEYLLDTEGINKTKKDLEIYTDEDLVFFAKWFSAKKIASKNDICSYIQELFEKEGRIKYI